MWENSELVDLEWCIYLNIKLQRGINRKGQGGCQLEHRRWHWWETVVQSIIYTANMKIVATNLSQQMEKIWHFSPLTLLHRLFLLSFQPFYSFSFNSNKIELQSFEIWMNLRIPPTFIYVKLALCCNRHFSGMQKSSSEFPGGHSNIQRTPKIWLKSSWYMWSDMYCITATFCFQFWPGTLSFHQSMLIHPYKQADRCFVSICS